MIKNFYALCNFNVVCVIDNTFYTKHHVCLQIYRWFTYRKFYPDAHPSHTLNSQSQTNGLHQVVIVPRQVNWPLALHC